VAVLSYAGTAGGAGKWQVMHVLDGDIEPGNNRPSARLISEYAYNWL